MATENQYLTAWAELKRLEPAMRNAGPWWVAEREGW